MSGHGAKVGNRALGGFKIRGTNVRDRVAADCPNSAKQPIIRPFEDVVRGLGSTPSGRAGGA